MTTPPVLHNASDESAPAPSGEMDFRYAHRKSVLWAGKIETALGSFDCIALDLSLGGARLRCAEPLRLLEPATLVLDRFGRFPAEVVWTTPHEIGLQFREPPEAIASRFSAVLPFGV